jgi:hypothetical protein
MTLETRQYDGDPDYGPTVKVRLVECPFCDADLRDASVVQHLGQCEAAAKVFEQ